MDRIKKLRKMASKHLSTDQFLSLLEIRDYSDDDIDTEENEQCGNLIEPVAVTSRDIKGTGGRNKTKKSMAEPEDAQKETPAVDLKRSEAYKKSRDNLFVQWKGNRESRWESPSPPRFGDEDSDRINENSKTADQLVRIERREFLERPRKYPKAKKSCDPNFMEEFKIVQKPKAKEAKPKKKVSPAYPIFVTPNKIEEGDGKYVQWEGLLIKRKVTPDPEDPFPLRHKTLYPAQYPYRNYGQSFMWR